MLRIEAIRGLVNEIYGRKLEGREIWADYLFHNHIFIVSDLAAKLSQKYHVKNDLAEAGSMLHDIADAIMSRFDSEHANATKKIAIEFLRKAGYSKDEEEIVINDILAKHGCRDGNIPLTLEGKIMSTADAIAHLSTDFYAFALSDKLHRKFPPQEVIEWALPKIERDFMIKIQFDEERELYRNDYEKVKNIFLILKA